MIAYVPKHQDQCCCSCRWLANLYCHPDNPAHLGYGKVTELFAHACIAPELSEHGDRRTAIFSARGHGICECYQKIAP